MTEESNLPTKETCDGGGALFGERRRNPFFLLIRFDRFVHFRPQKRARRKITFSRYFCPPFVQSRNWVFGQDGRTLSDCKVLVLQVKSPLTR